MAFNRLADRRLDAMNPRTQYAASASRRAFDGQRGGVHGRCVRWDLWPARCLFLPRQSDSAEASLPVLAFLFGYSFAKRFTVLSHFWLGAALMLAPLAAWVAIRAELAWAPVVLGAAVMLWVAGFDMIYACQDFDFDVKMRLRSVPARFGVAAALRLAAACHFGMVALLFLLPTGVRWVRLDLLGGRGGHRGAVGLRALARAARRPEPREPGVFPRQCRGQPRAAGRGSGGFDWFVGIEPACGFRSRHIMLQARIREKVEAGRAAFGGRRRVPVLAGGRFARRGRTGRRWCGGARMATWPTTTSICTSIRPTSASFAARCAPTVAKTKRRSARPT